VDYAEGVNDAKWVSQITILQNDRQTIQRKKINLTLKLINVNRE